MVPHLAIDVEKKYTHILTNSELINSVKLNEFIFISCYVGSFWPSLSPRWFSLISSCIRWSRMVNNPGESEAYATGLWRLVTTGHQPFSKTGRRIHNYLLSQNEVFQGLWRDNLIEFATGQYYPHCESCKRKKPSPLPRRAFTTEDVASLRVLKLNRP